MAERHRYTDRQMNQNYRRNSASQQMYVYGNVVTKPVYDPDRQEKLPERPKKKVSRQVKKNRKKAQHMSRGYVVFLAVAAMLALIVCVNYVRLQSSIVNRSKNITMMQEELADMKEENTTRQNAVMDSVNLDEVRDRAQNDLGMVYASPEQIVEYENPATDYVKQYEEIPKDGVLAQSDKTSR